MIMSKRESQNKIFREIFRNAFDAESKAAGHLLDDEDLLLRWAENQLSAHERNQVLGHMAQCAACRQGVATMVKQGILEFRPSAAEGHAEAETKEISPRSQSAGGKHPTRLLGAMMTTAACLMVGFFLMTGQVETPGPLGGDVPMVMPEAGTPRMRSGGDEVTVPGPRYALLVGINAYANLPESLWLRGCHNDIAEVKDVLAGRFGFLPENMTVLLDEDATADGIREQFRNLIRMVDEHPAGAEPAQVVFYFSGHGSRVPDQPPGHPDHDSDDGYDSTLVVYDSEKMGGEIDIRDDEINRFAHEICKNGKAQLMIVLDSCFSGGGARGGTRFRGIDRDLPRLVPDAADLQQIIPKTLPEGTVFFSACQSVQKEPEYQHAGKPYGLFTFYFTRFLRQEAIVSSLDYRALRDAITSAYALDKIVQPPTPTVEGDVMTLRKTVFGADTACDYKPYFEVEKDFADPQLLRMNAGCMAGVTKGSLYELYTRVEDTLTPGAASLGWFETARVEGGYSTGTLFRWADERRSGRVSATLPKDFRKGYAIQRYHEYGDNILRVRVEDGATGHVIPLSDETVPVPLRDLLLRSDSGERSRWLRWVDTAEDYDVVLRLDLSSGKAAVFPATGFAADGRDLKNSPSATPASLRGGWGMTDYRTPAGVKEIETTLLKIMKALSLKRLVAFKENPLTRPNKNGQPMLEITVIEAARGGSVQAAKPASGELVLDVQDRREHQLRVKNNGTVPLYLTILCIDPDMQIDAAPSFGPESNIHQFMAVAGLNNKPQANRLGPGQEFVSQFGFSAPFGAHTFVVLATREPSNFLHLIQPGLTRARSAGSESATRILEFLEEQCSPGTRATRQKTPPRDDTWSAASMEVITRSRDE